MFMMATEDFFGFDATQEDEGGLLPVNSKGTDDEAYDALNDETFGAVAERGDWEELHETLLGRTSEENNGSSLLRSIGIPNGNSSTNFSPNSSYSAFDQSPGKSLLDSVNFPESPGSSIWTEPSLIDKMTKSFNTPPREAPTSSNLYNFLLQPSLNANPPQMDMVMRQNQTFSGQPQQHQNSLLGGVDQSHSVQSMMQQMNNQPNQLNLMFSNSMGGASDSSRPANMGLPFGQGKIKSVTDLENELRLQQMHKLNQVNEEIRQEKGAKQLQPFFSEEQEAQQREKNQLVDIEPKKQHAPHQHQQHHNQHQQHHNQHGQAHAQPPHRPVYHNNPIHPLTRLPITPPQPQHMAGQQMLLRLTQQQHFQQQQRHMLNSSAGQRWQQQQQQLSHAYRNFPAGPRQDPGAGQSRGKDNRPFERRRSDNSFSEGGAAEWEEWERARAADPYAGLMTPKQRAWLRNIQLMQLSSADPYQDDYYAVMRAAKQRRARAHSPLRIEGLERLLPQPQGDRSAPQYTPPACENSLGKLQVASVNAPRKILDVSCCPRPASSRLRHTLLLLERLLASLMRLEDLDRKISVMFDSPTRDAFIAAARRLLEQLWAAVSGDPAQMLALLNVAKGKALFSNLLLRLPYLRALHGFRFVLDNLSSLTHSSDSNNHNTLDRLWPVADKIISNADADALIDYASRLSPYLEAPKDGKAGGLPMLLSTKFGLTVFVALLIKGEQQHERVVGSAAWQRFLAAAIQAVAQTQPPEAAEPKVKVLGRGQSLSSVLRPAEAGLGATLPLLAVAGGREPPDPSLHLARCSAHAQSRSLQAAQRALQRLQLAPRPPLLL